jgi:hypothetical protein
MEHTTTNWSNDDIGDHIVQFLARFPVAHNLMLTGQQWRGEIARTPEDWCLSEIRASDSDSWWIMMFCHVRKPEMYMLKNHPERDSWACKIFHLDAKGLAQTEPARRAASYNKRAAMLRLRRQILKDDGFFDDEDD